MAEILNADWSLIDPRKILLPLILEAETDVGVKVKDIRMQNDHYLVYKFQMRSESSGTYGEAIDLPDTYAKKSQRNLVSIKGIIVATSESYRSKHPIRKKYFDQGISAYRMKADGFKDGEIVTPTLKIGDGIIYNSYNIGRITIVGAKESLAIVRGLDIDAEFDVSNFGEVELGDFAMSRPGAWY